MSTPQRSQAKESSQTERKRPDSAKPQTQAENLPPLAIQQTLVDPSAATPASLLSLQQSHGNRAVQNLIQRQPEEEELLQMKPAGATPGEVIQRQSLEEEELLQMKPAGPAPDRIIQQRPDEDKRRKMEGAFGSDFSDVRVHSGASAPSLSALAYTQGSDIAFAPGAAAPSAAPGESPLLGHELAHVVQQREGRRREELQMKPGEGAQKGGALTPEIADEIQRQRGSGQTLDVAVQSQMGSALGADFSQVHVHADAQADELNRSLNAKAFTIGADVFFRDGHYNPGSSNGQELLAHELTHVVQQTGGAAPAAPQTKLTLGPVGDQYEQEADQAARQIVRQTNGNQLRRKPLGAIRASVIQRAAWDDVGMTETAWKALTPTQQQQKKNAHAFQQHGSATGVGKGLETAGDWAGGLAIGSMGAAVGSTGDVLSSVKESDPGYAGSHLEKASNSFGVIGGSMQLLGSGVEFAGQASQFHRGRTLAGRGGGAGKLLGRRMMRRSGLSMIEKGLGMGAGASSIASAAYGFQDKSGQSDAAGATGGAFQIGGEMLGLGRGIASLRSASRRQGQASAAATKYGSAKIKDATGKEVVNPEHDAELAQMAQFSGANQNKFGKGLGLLKNLTGMGAGAAKIGGAAGGNKFASAVAGTVLGGVSSLAGLAQGAYNKYQKGKKDASGKTAEENAEAHADKLITRLAAGDAKAAQFAQSVFGIEGAADMAKNDAEALKELLKQKMTKYD